MRRENEVPFLLSRQARATSSHIAAQLLAVALILGFSFGIASADYKKLTMKGNEAYAKDDFATALKNYHEAEIEHPKDPLLNYNIGTALHSQADYENAIKQFGGALETNDAALQSDVYYNLGSAFFRAQKYQPAISAFQKTLELNPDDVDAKYNLELARKKLKEQSSQQNQQQNQDQQQEQDQEQQEQKQDQQQQQQEQNQSQQQDQKQDQQNQNQDQQDQQQDQQQNQRQQQGGEGEEQKEQQMSGAQQEQKGMSKQDAERILKAIEGDEKDIQKKMPKVKGTARYGGKTW